jgi:putative endonuclease
MCLLNTEISDKNMYYTYILKCADETFYTGCTHDLERRIKEHNTSKRGAHYTKIRRPVEIFFKEEFLTLKEARKREGEIKKMSRKEKMSLV